jgi:hypothetical protein
MTSSSPSGNSEREEAVWPAKDERVRVRVGSCVPGTVTDDLGPACVLVRFDNGVEISCLRVQLVAV